MLFQKKKTSIKCIGKKQNNLPQPERYVQKLYAMFHSSYILQLVPIDDEILMLF